MKPNKTREELEQELIKTVNQVKHNKEIVSKLEDSLKDHGLTTGMTQKYLMNPEQEFTQMDIRLLGLFTDKLFKITGNTNLRTDIYFTDVDIKKIKIYEYEYHEDLLKYPLVFLNMVKNNDENYIGTVHISYISKLLKSKILRYDFETQREAKYERRNDTIQKVPRLFPKSIKEIDEKTANNDLDPTTITFNAVAGSSDLGEEIIYNNKNHELTITEGTFITILDGMNRISGVLNAYEKNPNLDFTFDLAIKNFTESRAKKFLSDLFKANPVNTTHAASLDTSRNANKVVYNLLRDSDLQGKVSTSNRVHITGSELCSFNVLSDTIDEEFELNTNKDVLDVSNYLKNFFDYLIGSFPDEFIHKVKETRNGSLINDNNMFAGYVILAKKMKNKGIKLNEIVNIVKGVDFNKDNHLWEELNILKNGNLTKKARNNIKEFFKEMYL